MALTPDATVTALTAGTGNISGNHTPAATCHAIVVKIAQVSTTTDQVSGVTAGGVAMTRSRTYAQATTAGAAYMYEIFGTFPAGTPVAIVVTVSGAATKQVVVEGIVAGSGVVQHTAGEDATRVGLATSPVMTIPTAAGKATLCHAVASISDSINTVSVTAPSTQTHESGTTSAARSCALRAGTGGNVDIGWTFNNDNIAAVGVAYSEGAGGPTQLEATGSSAITTAGTGAATAQTLASSSSAITTTATASARATVQASSSAAIVTTAGGTATVGVNASSTAAITTSGTAAATARTSATGSSAITTTATGAATARTAASGSAAITTTATGAATARTEASGSTAITVTATGTASVPGVLQASGAASITVAGTAAATARTSATGSSAIVITASGTATVPGALQATGSAAIVTSAAGAATATTRATGNATVVLTAAGFAVAQVLATGTADLLITATGTAGFGIPEPVVFGVISGGVARTALHGMAYGANVGAAHASEAGGAHDAETGNARTTGVVA